MGVREGDGKLVLIDFGLCSELPKPTTNQLTTSIVHLLTGNFPELLQDGIKLGFLPEDVNKSDLLPKGFSKGWHKVTEVLNQGFANGLSVQEKRVYFQTISNDLNDIFFEFPFSVPPYFALMTRALTVLEGIALKSDPKFDIFKAAWPYASRRAVTLFGPDVLAVGTAAVAGVTPIPALESSGSNTSTKAASFKLDDKSTRMKCPFAFSNIAGTIL